MNILFLNAYFEPESIAFSHLEHDLLLALVKDGHEVFVLCPTPTRGVDEARIREYKTKFKEDLYGGHVHVTRFRAPQEGKNPLMRAFRYLWCNLRTYTLSKKFENIDLIFCNSTPPTQGRLAALVKKKLSKKKDVIFLFNLQDIFPDSLVNANMIKEGSLVWKIGRRLEDSTYKNSDRIITISNSFKANIVKKGVNPEKVYVIPNWVDTSEVYPISRDNNLLFERYGLDKSKFYICYSGNIGHSQNMELLLDVAKEIEDDDVRFVLIGDGAAKSKIEKRVSDEKIKNIIMLPFQPYEDIAHVFSLGDVGLIISKPGIGGSSVPSKTWSIMATERPILASFDIGSELSNLISNVGCGITVAAGDKDSFVDAIKKLKQDCKHEMGCNGKEYVSEVISKDKCVGMYLKLMEK